MGRNVDPRNVDPEVALALKEYGDPEILADILSRCGQEDVGICTSFCSRFGTAQCPHPQDTPGRCPKFELAFTDKDEADRAILTALGVVEPQHRTGG